MTSFAAAASKLTPGPETYANNESTEIFDMQQQSSSFEKGAGSSIRPSSPVTKTGNGKIRKICFISALSVSLVLSLLLVVCLVAVILYSPQVRVEATPDQISAMEQASLLARIEQLESQTNNTVDTLNSVQEKQAPLLARIEQLEQRNERLENRTNNTVDTLNSVQEKQDSVQTSIEQLSATATSQLSSFNSTQTTMREDLDTLSTVDLYQNCTQESKSCIFTGGTGYYRRHCSTIAVTVDPSDTQYYTTDVRCEYDSIYKYFESTILRRIDGGVGHFCFCSVTRPIDTTDAYKELPSDYKGTCTLTLTRCPRTLNLLSGKAAEN